MPRKENLPPPSVLERASAWLEENIESLATAITSRIFSHSELQKESRDTGRPKCQEDVIYHLHYLSEAIMSDSESMFRDYIGWTKIMLHSRGIPPSALAVTLEAMAQTLKRKTEPDFKPIFDRFLRSGLGALPSLPETLPSFIDAKNPCSELANAYLHSLLVLNREEAIAKVVAELEAGLSFKDLFQHVIYPVQKEVGRLWQENRITVLQEHYCTAATDVLITTSKRKFLGNRRNVTALAVCADGEEHSLGLRMFCDMLESDGWKVAYVGSKSPVADVIKHLRANTTDLVAISVASPLNLRKTRELITKIKTLSARIRPRILVGGSIVSSEPDLWQRLGADAAGTTVSEGLEAANRLIADRDRSR